MQVLHAMEEGHQGDAATDQAAGEADPTEIARRQPGDFVGEMALLNSAPRMASAKACGDVKCAYLGRDDFLELLA